MKTTEQQDLQCIHRIWDRLMQNRTALINHTRGLLAEYGVVLPKGAKRFTFVVEEVIAASRLPVLARELFFELVDQLADVDRRVTRIDEKLVGICKEHATCRRLMAMPGVGPVVATALVAAVDDARNFRSGRDLAAWIGLAPRQYTTGGKPRLGGIGQPLSPTPAGARRPLGGQSHKESYRSTRRVGQGTPSETRLQQGGGCPRQQDARAAWAMLARGEAYRAA